ncbi:MAG: hypothetical protein KAR20_05650 [Candidatus Heimdallarchaeota archaeon]|nr:hypothetical protein [Candidatus Heimdallarchaeota archaeon]
MALSDPTKAITTDLNDISYTAGQEPWNKNLDQFKFDSKDTEVNNYIPDWTKWHGIYRTVPEARSTIDVNSFWIVGKKLVMDEKTAKIVARIKGNGKDTFRKILKNIKRKSKICGDGFGSIVRDKANRLINLKPLNPGTIRIVSDKKSMILRYEQVASTKTDAEVLETWQPHEMFHIPNDRIADEIHGIPELEKTFNIMKWKHQAMGDLATVYHRYVFPILDIYAKTDDLVELAHIAKIYTDSIKDMTHRVIPVDTVEKVDRVAIPQFATLDPLPWLKFLRSFHTESSNVPELVRGKSDEVSLAAGKLNVLSYKEKVIMEQLEYSEDIESQLGLTIGFEEPPEIDIELGINNTNESNK